MDLQDYLLNPATKPYEVEKYYITCMLADAVKGRCSGAPMRFLKDLGMELQVSGRRRTQGDAEDHS